MKIVLFLSFSYLRSFTVEELNKHRNAFFLNAGNYDRELQSSVDWGLDNSEVWSSLLKHVLFTILKIPPEATEISNMLLTCTQSKGHISV